MEIWKDALVDGYEGLYQVSNQGRVRSIRFGTPRVRALVFDKDGYLIVGFCLNRKERKLKVHRLVLSAFENVNYDYYKEVNHKDGIKTNNQIGNLEWATRSENMQHAFENRLMNIPYYEVYDKETNELVFKGDMKSCGLFMGKSREYIRARKIRNLPSENEKYYWKLEEESEDAKI